MNTETQRRIKKALLYLMALPIIFTLSTCEDALELLPPDALVKDEYWQTAEDVEATLMGAYKQFADMNDRLFYYGELRGDMLTDDFALDRELEQIMYSNIYPWNDWVEWQDLYSVINYTNTVLKYSAQVKEIDPTFTDYEYQVFNAEATFLRSLAYFYLIRVYKDVPLVFDPFDSDEEDFFRGKTNSELILDTIITQTAGVLSNLPEGYETLDITRGRATRAAANALLAEMELWRFNYQACINYVDAIEASELYELMPSGKWYNIFTTGNTLEGIFEIQFNSRLGQNNDVAGITNNTSNNFEASDYAMELLSIDLTDEVVRGNGTVNRTRDIWKFIGSSPDGESKRSGSVFSSCNWIIYRLADVMLMKAEALSQLGQYAEAAVIVNAIRNRALVDPLSSVPNNPSGFEDVVMEERARELAYEGKRWFDLMRMGRRPSQDGEKYARKTELIQILIRNVPATQKRVLATKLNDPNGWYLPIHEDEIENNPELVQNPYYQIYERD